MLYRSLALAVVLAGFACTHAVAQERGSLEPRNLSPLADPGDPSLPAKQVFGRETEPSAGPPHVYGFYARGCIAGASRCRRTDRSGR